MLDEYLTIIDHIFRTHHLMVGLEAMWSGNNYKNNKL
jgi:hypothetical protein